MSAANCSAYHIHIRRTLKTLFYRYFIRLSKNASSNEDKTETMCSRMQNDAFHSMRLNQAVL
jgi:hypothetical protein